MLHQISLTEVATMTTKNYEKRRRRKWISDSTIRHRLQQRVHSFLEKVTGDQLISRLFLLT